MMHIMNSLGNFITVTVKDMSTTKHFSGLVVDVLDFKGIDSLGVIKMVVLGKGSKDLELVEFDVYDVVRVASYKVNETQIQAFKDYQKLYNELKDLEQEKSNIENKLLEKSNQMVTLEYSAF